MSFDPATLFVSLMTSAIGYALFSYGRKQSRLPQVVGGLLLMVYPYFVSSFTSMLVIGVAITAAVWFATEMGW